MKCFICISDNGQPVYRLSDEKFETIKRFANLRVQYGDLKLTDLITRCDKCSIENYGYHKSCFFEIRSEEKLQRFKSKFEKNECDVKSTRKRGRPTSSLPSDSLPSSSKRRASNFDSTKCVLCQSDDQKQGLHEVQTEALGTKLKNIALNTDDDSLKARLSELIASDDALAAVAYELKYHLNCLMFHSRKSVENNSILPKDREQYITKLISTKELIYVVNKELSVPGTTVNMNEVNATFVDILEGNGYQSFSDSKDYKKYLKSELTNNIFGVDFSRNSSTKPEIVTLKVTKDAAVSSFDEHSKISDEFSLILQAANLLRTSILQSSKWSFKGKFDDFEIPPLLFHFCKILNFGVKKIGEMKSEKPLQDKHASIMSQFIIQSIKTRGQTSDDCFIRETPLSVGLGLRVHNQTRSKTLLHLLEQLNMTVSYDKILQIETDVANTVSEESLNSNIFIPTCIERDNFSWFAIDNIDFLECTPTGADTFHGTVTAIYQKKKDSEAPKSLVLKRESKRTSLENEIEVSVEQCPKVVTKPIVLPYTTDNAKAELDIRKNIFIDKLWAASFCSDDGEKNYLPVTWSAFHSILSKTEPLTQVCLLAPVLKSPPSNFDVLYSALLRAHKTCNKITPDKPTVIVMDMQLYEMSMKLWIASDDIKRKFIFRPGELHTVFWALSALGSYIEGSGVDQAWMEAGIYSSKVIASILNGKNMYRCLEAHFITFLSFFKLSMTVLKNAESSLFDEITQLTKSLNDAQETNLKIKVDEISNELEGVFEKLSAYESSLPKLQLFIMNYMKQFLIILQFIKASRQNDFSRHLACTELLCKYFFAHGHTNYSRMLPLYLSSMTYVKEKHPETFENFKNGFFSVTKNKVPFTSIGSDHALEHENRKLKVQGGLVNITQKPKTLDRFFLIAPEMLKIINDFDDIFKIATSISEQHHELSSGSKLKRILSNVDNLSQTFITHGNPFENQKSELFNLMTKKVLPADFESDVLNRDKIGQELFEKFITERLNEGKIGIWDPLKKNNLKGFKNVNVEKAIKMDDKIVKIKEERNLLQRFVIASRSRPDLDIKTAIGNYEFGVVPRSLFASDGTFLLASDKSKILHKLEQLVDHEKAAIDDNQKSKPSEILIIDGMALLHTISKTDEMKHMNDFFVSFLKKLLRLSENFVGVRLIFDRYITNSLKNQTRRKRGEDSEGYFHITDATVIRNVPLKDLFANLKTKTELIEYVSTKLLSVASTSKSNSLKNLMITYDTKTVGNVEIPKNLQEHNHEEADSLVILHLFSLQNSGYNAAVMSPDTDIFIFLLYFFDELSMDITFITGGFGDSSRRIAISPIHEILGITKAKALLFFHSFTGSDLTGKFAGKTKEFCFRTFLATSDDILKVFSRLTNGEELTNELLAELQKFICELYKQPKFRAIPDLRWFLFSNKGNQGEDLPPTVAALKPHALRAQYVAAMWGKSSISILNLPTLDKYGWKELDGQMVPIMCLEDPAPKAILQLIKCGCRKKCAGKCSCAKNGLECTDLCTCINCDNTMNTETFEASEDV